MKKILIMTAVLLLLNPVWTSANPVKKGMDALKKNHYEEAAGFFAAALPSAGKTQDGLYNLNFGIALAESAKLYRELYGLSLRLHADYLKRIASVSGRDRSRYARLYLGKTLLEAGRPKEAAAAFNKFISEKNVGQRHRLIAKAGLGLAYYRLGMKSKALAVWGQIKSSDPEVLAELAYAYNSAGGKGKDAVALADRALKLVKESKKKPSMLITSNLIGVYAGAGLVEKGFELLRVSGGSNLNDYSYEETIGKNKVIRFYDTRLLANLADFYGVAAVKFLKNASADAKLEGVAGFYLAETYAVLNDSAASARALEGAISSGRLPPQLKYKADVIVAENLYRKGRKDEALGRIRGFSRGNPSIELLAETLLTCAKVGEACKETVSKAEALAGASPGSKKFAALNQALGRYFLQKSDYIKAVKYMEDGRDKSNKNKIEYNDPKILAAISEAYYDTKQFSEALEIFFEMNKHFPAVRQIQVVLQGIYSMEQKSAGDVKIL